MMIANAEILIGKIQTLSPDQLAEVDRFVNFLRFRDQERALTRPAAQVREPTFAAVWDNPDDEVYNTL